MQLQTIQRILGQLLMLFSALMLPPLVVSFGFRDGAHVAFIEALVLILIVGLALWIPVRRSRRELRLRDGFLIVVMFWVGLSLTGAVPLLDEAGHESGAAGPDSTALTELKPSRLPWILLGAVTVVTVTAVVLAVIYLT